MISGNRSHLYDLLALLAGDWRGTSRNCQVDEMDENYNSSSLISAIFSKCFNRPILSGIFLWIGTEILAGFPDFT